MFENIPAGEPEQIQRIVDLTGQQMARRYSGGNPMLRGVHPKGHGCVTAAFEVLNGLTEDLRHGVFATPGRKYEAVVRFSNADPLVKPDSTPGAAGAPPAHGSRGMAVKLFGVEGPDLGFGAGEQDFLLVNQPVFAFANVEDYVVLSRVLQDNQDDAAKFFAERLAPASPPEARQRAADTLKIVGRIRAADLPAAFQKPPASPVDNDYFGAAPFLLGPNQAMRIRVRPVARSSAEPNVADPNYLSNALAERLRDAAAGPAVFAVEVQTLAADQIKPDEHIENASKDWPDAIPFRPVATLTIPLQEFDAPELRERCQRLAFTPWHGLQDHRPLGGINRLRRAVYEASFRLRCAAGGGCPR